MILDLTPKKFCSLRPH